MRGTSDPANSVRFLSTTMSSDLVVGGNVILEGGYTTLSGGSTTGTILNIYVGSNFVIKAGATLDSRNSGSGSFATILFTNTATTHYFTNAGAIAHTGSGSGCPINWIVGVGAQLALESGNIPLFGANGGLRDSVNVSGTLTFNTSQITAGVTNGGDFSLAFMATVNGNGTNELASGLTNMVIGGTLNLGTMPSLSAGQSFVLFGAAAYSGSFGSIIPATPATGLVWDTSQLLVNGSLVVANPGSGPNPNPTNITVLSLTSSNITLQWPSDHTGWALQAQTNSASSGLSTNWNTLSGSTATNEVTIPIDPTQGNVFFRMSLH
jgi:hypothetical protein